MNDWLIVNDGVMGGLSKSRFVLSDGNTAQVNFNWRFNGLKLISKRCIVPEEMRRQARLFTSLYCPERDETGRLACAPGCKCSKPLRKAKIKKPASLHWLRHSYATHLLEKGTDIRHIQLLPGHKSSKTTEIYTHVSISSLQKISSPFDDLM